MKQAEEGKLPRSGGVAGTAPDRDFGHEKVCPGHLRPPLGAYWLSLGPVRGRAFPGLGRREGSCQEMGWGSKHGPGDLEDTGRRVRTPTQRSEGWE